MTPHLRPGLPADAYACADILGAFFTDTTWLPRLHDAHEDWAFLASLIARDLVTVVEHEVSVCGYLAREENDLMHLYVAERWRGHGIGSALLEDAMKRTGRLDLWCFQANAPARKFYTRHGFVAGQATDGSGNEEGLPDIQYRWSA